jgi:hypothetical protein
MSIITTLQKNKNRYLDHCLEGLQLNMDAIRIDYSKGETDNVTLLTIAKNSLSKHQAISILTFRLMLYIEEWNDLANYKAEDINRWSKRIKLQYKNTIYNYDIDLTKDSGYYFIERLEKEHEIKSIKHNNKTIDYKIFQNINPLLREPILQSSKTQFNHLETEFYIETENQFILFNWFTTA